MGVEIKYIPLSFINTEEEILKQIKNTVLFSYLFQTFEETSLNYYLESTQYGYNASSSASGTHQLVRITDINSGKVNWNNVPFCDCNAEEKYLLNDDDILVARTGGTTGKSFIVNSAPYNAIFASYLIRLRLKKEVNLEFINLYLNSYAFWSQIVEMKSGSAMPNVNAEKLKTLRIPKISFKEQNEFVTSFKNIEKAKNLNSLFNKINEVESLFKNSKEIVNELTQQLDLIKQLRQSFLREAMQGKLLPVIASEARQSQETGQQLLAKIKAEKAKLIAEKKLKKEKELPLIVADEIPFEIPEHWTWCRLGEICTKVTDGFHNTPKKLENGKIYISATHIKDTGIKWDECLYVSEKDHLELYKKASPQKGEILITNRGAGCGTPAIIDIDEVFSFQNTALIGFNQSMINNKYVYNFILKSRDEIMEKFVNGGLQPMLSNVILKTVPFPLPPLHEQEQIVAKLEELMSFCDGLEQSIKESQGYNEMLLQQVLREALQT
jgi:type I restriction enzyme S subunit